jgi:hypothetical protein
MRALEEKVGLFRLYLKDVAGPSGASHRHKLLFASQYLVETAVQLLRAIDVAALETTIQMAVRTALVAQRIFAIAFRKHGGGGGDSGSESGSSVHEKHTPLKSLMPLLTDCLVTLTNAVWKRGLQLPDPALRLQLDESCTNIGASARVFIDVCSERRKMVMRNSKRPSSSSSRLRERVTVAAAAAAAAESQQQQQRRARADSDSDAASTSASSSPAPLGKTDLAKKANEALDLLQVQLAHTCALLAASGDSSTHGASVAAEVDRARKQLFRIIDTHLHSESSLRPDGSRSGPSKAELSGNAVLRLAMLLKRLVVDFESLKLVPGSLTASAVAVSGIDGGDGIDERPVMRVTSVQSLSKLIRELTQTASSLVEQLPPSPVLQQVHVFIVVARRYLLRLQLACMAQIAGSPIQVHVPLPLLLRGMATTLSLLVRGLDEIGVVRTEREAWKQQRGKASRHRRRSTRIRATDSLDLSTQQQAQPSPAQSQQADGEQAAESSTPSQGQQQQQQQQQQQATLQPSSSSASLSSSTATVKRIESSGDEKSSRTSSLRDTRSGSLRHRESPSSSRPGSKPGSLRNNRRSTELMLDGQTRQDANSSPPRMIASKRKSMPPNSVHIRDD